LKLKTFIFQQRLALHYITNSDTVTGHFYIGRHILLCLSSLSLRQSLCTGNIKLGSTSTNYLNKIYFGYQLQPLSVVLFKYNYLFQIQTYLLNFFERNCICCSRRSYL